MQHRPHHVQLIFSHLTFYFASPGPYVTMARIILWGFLYAPCFLNVSAYLISAAPDALEFASTMATSFGNLGISAGTAVGGWVIVHYGIGITPWAGMVFGAAALLLIGVRERLERKKEILRQCRA